LGQVNSSASNENSYETAGLDVELTYNTELSDVINALRGNLNVSFLYTFLNEWEIIGQEDGDVDDRLGEVLYPEHRWIMTTEYTLDNLAITWRMRFWDDVKDSNTPELQNDNAAIQISGGSISGFAFAENDVESIFYHDLRVHYDVTEKVSLYLGIRNVFDEGPPKPLLTQFSNYGNTGINTAAEAYDVIGRRYYAGIQVAF